MKNLDSLSDADLWDLFLDYNPDFSSGEEDEESETDNE